MRRGYMVLRNCLCGVLALGLIAFGVVGRARRRALSGDVVTAIYFHKPNRRLFARCIRWLVEHGFTFISADDLVEILYHGRTPPKGAVWLSFDDGFKEVLEDVVPLIRQLKIPITLFLPAGVIEGDGLLPWLRATAVDGVRNGLTVEEVKLVAGYPEVTIGSHTVSHAVTANLTEEKARFELGESKRTLEGWICADVKCFAYPEGRFDGREKALLAEFGYRFAATTENVLVTRETDPYLLPRLSVADEIWFPEAICNLVGVWRPVVDPVIRLLQPGRRIIDSVREAWGTQRTQSVSKSGQSVEAARSQVGNR